MTHEPDEQPEWVSSLAAALRHPASQSPQPKETGTLRKAAVLVLLTDGPDGVKVLLTERASGITYAGRVSFPGGRQDPGDADSTVTALREAREEVGLNPAGLHILGALPAVVDPNGTNIVTPVLAWSASTDFEGPVSVAEVAKVHQVNIRDLCAATGTAQESEELAALAGKLGQMTAAILNTVVALLNG
jgi:8-oxo-dGTP pyrophosphatase MutT (NUDIX family)